MDVNLEAGQIIDPLLENLELVSIIRLYQSNSVLQRLIDQKLDMIQRLFGYSNFSTFQEVVDAYEKEIVGLPFGFALPRAAKHSLKLTQRVLYEHPMPQMPKSEFKIRHLLPQDSLMERVRLGGLPVGRGAVQFLVPDGNISYPEIDTRGKINKYIEIYYDTIITAVMAAMTNKNFDVAKELLEVLSRLSGVWFRKEPRNLRPIFSDRPKLLEVAEITGAPAEIVNMIQNLWKKMKF